MNWDEEHDRLVEACRRSDPPLWADLLLFTILMCVAGWLTYLMITAP